MAVMATEQPQGISVGQKVDGVAPEKDKMAVDESDVEEPAPEAVNG
jgi:hypothetical protein